VGGRYQIIQVDLSGCSLSVKATPLVLPASVAEAWSTGFSRFSPGVFRSEGAPGVLGVPNDAKAPEPRPNAEEAFVDGEDTPPERGERALKGLDRPPWELSGPKRLVARGSSTRAPSVPVIDRDNLEVLDRRVQRFALSMEIASDGPESERSSAGDTGSGGRVVLRRGGGGRDSRWWTKISSNQRRSSDTGPKSENY
jgi:hypothetical protein